VFLKQHFSIKAVCVVERERERCVCVCGARLSLLTRKLKLFGFSSWKTVGVHLIPFAFLTRKRGSGKLAKSRSPMITAFESSTHCSIDSSFLLENSFFSASDGVTDKSVDSSPYPCYATIVFESLDSVTIWTMSPYQKLNLVFE